MTGRGFLLCLLLPACAVETEDLGSTELAVVLVNNHPLENPLGQSTTWSTSGFIDDATAFNEDLGTNGRTCGSCHKPTEGWTVSAAAIAAVFEATAGLDPIFRLNDGSNSPIADVSSLEARRAAFSMLLTRGLIRVGIGIPAGAEFELVGVDDPYAFASAQELSLFRRPLPSANLTLIPVVMWDGRVPGTTVRAALSDQSNGATQGHAARPDPLATDVRTEIVDFETGLFNAQILTIPAGRLDADGAKGGAAALARQGFVAARFNLFDAYVNSDNPARRAIFRGQEVFNTKTRPNGGGACRGCHSAQNIGSNRNGIFFGIGTSAGSRRTPDLPLYTLRRISTGELFETTDPGRALITGKWTDLNRFKVPQIRALGARAPYFHDGSAATLDDVVAFYEESLGFAFTGTERDDLIAFLTAL
jgi:cytochrome c peroxidase